MFFHKKTKWVPWVSGGAAVLNVVLNLVLIPLLGAVAAAVSTLVAQAMMALIFHVISRRLGKMPYPYMQAVLPVVVLIVTAVCLSFYITPHDISLLTRMGLWLGLGLSFIPIVMYGKRVKVVS